jgi:hypothetical protein
MAHLKLLTMCQGGNSRSVSLAYLLKYVYGHDALACGWEKNDVKTRNMLCKWADRIFIMQAEFERFIPKKYKEKVTAYDVGPDIWCNPFHPDLLEKCNNYIISDPQWMVFEVDNLHHT